MHDFDKFIKIDVLGHTFKRQCDHFEFQPRKQQ